MDNPADHPLREVDFRVTFSGNCRHTRQQWYQHYFERLIFGPGQLVV